MTRVAKKVVKMYRFKYFSVSFTFAALLFDECFFSFQIRRIVPFIMLKVAIPFQ